MSSTRCSYSLSSNTSGGDCAESVSLGLKYYFSCDVKRRYMTCGVDCGWFYGVQDSSDIYKPHLAFAVKHKIRHISSSKAFLVFSDASREECGTPRYI